MRFFILTIFFLHLLSVNQIIAKTKEPLIEQFFPKDADAYFSEFDKGYFKQYLLLSNFPKNSNGNIQIKRLASPNIEKLGAFTFDEEGSFVYVISARGFLPGERATFQFVNENGKVIAEKSIFPNPLIATSEEATFTIEAELKGISYSFKILKAKSSEKFDITSVSHGKSNTTQCTYANGIEVFPRVKGFDGGIAKVIVTRKENGDKAALVLMWGKEIPKYFMNAHLEAHPEWREKLELMEGKNK
jgi:hypothetical protein